VASRVGPIKIVITDLISATQPRARHLDFLAGAFVSMSRASYDPALRQMTGKVIGDAEKDALKQTGDAPPATGQATVLGRWNDIASAMRFGNKPSTVKHQQSRGLCLPP
jgi:hypothetical protein